MPMNELPKERKNATSADGGGPLDDGIDDGVAVCRDHAAAATQALRDVGWFLTTVDNSSAPGEPLRRLRGELEAVATSCNSIVDGLKHHSWGDLKLPKLLLRETSGWDQHQLTSEQREGPWKNTGERMQTVFERLRREHPGEPYCKECDGLGLWHTEDAFGLCILPCPECNQYSSDEEAVIAHRHVCGCSYPETAPMDFWNRGICLEKGYELEGIACPRCGQTRGFRLEVKQLVLVHDRKPVDLGQYGFDGKTPTECVKCHHSGALEEFCAREKFQAVQGGSSREADERPAVP